MQRLTHRPKDRLTQRLEQRPALEAPHRLKQRRHGLRQLAAGVVAWCLGLGLAQAAPPLPVRNLSVEMRIADDSELTQQDARAGGMVTLGSTGRVEAAGGVTLRAGSRRAAADSVQRVLVLNGARATMHLSQGVPVDDTELFWSPWGAGAAVRTQWIELVNGMEVTPRWPGGNAPVTLDIAAQRASPAASPGAYAPAGQAAVPAQWSLLSTVQVPLGEWVSVAQLQGRRSTLSSNGFDAATTTRQRSLQVRVSLP